MNLLFKICFFKYPIPHNFGQNLGSNGRIGVSLQKFFITFRNPGLSQFLSFYIIKSKKVVHFWK